MLAGFPPGACRVVASCASHDVAYVLLDTAPTGWRYLYGVNVERRGGVWTEGSSGNGSGWSRVDPDEELGTLTLWDDAPQGADRVRARFNGELFETPIQNGAYLFVWWNIVCPDDWPRLEAFRIAGAWIPAGRWPLVDHGHPLNVD